jgi:hypothetical protein
VGGSKSDSKAFGDYFVVGRWQKMMGAPGLSEVYQIVVYILADLYVFVNFC